jgi:hypothetical protein
MLSFFRDGQGIVARVEDKTLLDVWPKTGSARTSSELNTGLLKQQFNTSSKASLEPYASVLDT